MQMANGVAMLELHYQGFVIHPTLVWDQGMAVLIDTGFPGQMEELHEAIVQVGVSLNQLKAIILTHQDVDHIGCLPDLLQVCGPHVQVYAHALDKPYIQGELPLVKDGHLENPPKGKVDVVLSDGEELPFCGGIRVIHTPGHTPGHISLYLTQSKTLVAGDAMYSVDGHIEGVHEPTALDVEEARQSLQKCLDIDLEAVICYHGGISRGAVLEQMKKILS
ncbi:MULTISPECIES: MBL fold metallo-hydrolase [Lysinibacillus]|uniref:MBL fold metallo-hydrolase n=1 Tax=Lysinibacillus fusiformis TaxID=28031 RepID=A0A2I0UXT4_9BACI|nr:MULTISPECIES: MBL fold metallo-hydrolase [Lysinibacillus]PKU50890.1 MBL fold metallo-hydrolase [Lysinibacillus fusiformis]SCY13327.1 Glyoxylase, beta-lactamase superfamily II [Lysinibacillus sp. SG9]SDB11949.1 Glyoxylase, beta-lactamase superfamily II [Lysinibacillus sp. TC-37]SFS49308.1 Glyoxylase, beta-lactamase superfamily II [Lysinibacillus sp. SG55]